MLNWNTNFFKVKIKICWHVEKTTVLIFQVRRTRPDMTFSPAIPMNIEDNIRKFRACSCFVLVTINSLTCTFTFAVQKCWPDQQVFTNFNIDKHNTCHTAYPESWPSYPTVMTRGCLYPAMNCDVTTRVQCVHPTVRQVTLSGLSEPVTL